MYLQQVKQTLRGVTPSLMRNEPSHITGGSAKAAGDLVAKAGGKTLKYIFVIRANTLKGWERLDAPAYAMIGLDN